jgi:translation initiation factor IF-2
VIPVAKRRLHKVAKEFKVSSEALREMLRAMGVPVKSYMSFLDDKTVEAIRKRFEEEKASVREEYARKRELQARKRGKHREADASILESEGVGARSRSRLRGAGRGRRSADEKEVKETVKQTLARIELGGTKRKRRRQRDDELAVETEETQKVAKVREFMTVGELAQAMRVGLNEVMENCLKLGLTVTKNHRLDMVSVHAVADQMGFEVEEAAEYGEEVTEEERQRPGVPRHPVVTMMGHVDHGKTSLLDFIRRSNIVAGESGGITQHLGAYQVETEGQRITFLDTPGHAAFTAMRARGAQVTDIVVLVVAADEGVMPQTVEAIDHAREAEVPIVVAISKIDLEQARPDSVKEQLSKRGLSPEDWGGNTLFAEVSAITGAGIDQLLEAILLQAEMMELQAPVSGRARGVVIESRVDKGFGPVATVLVQEGTLRVGDSFVAGVFSGKTRALLNERLARVGEANPGTPIVVLGLSGLPEAGDPFTVVTSDRAARDIAERRHQLKKERELTRPKRATLDELAKRIQSGQATELKVILKGDVHGSVEAVHDALEKLHHEEITLEIVLQSVGDITESDVQLASASQAVVIGFNVTPTAEAQALAGLEGVDIRVYAVIYELLDDVRAAMEGLLAPEFVESVIGETEVRQVFRTSKSGVVAGCYVTSGNVARNAFVRVRRQGQVIHQGRIASLRRFKDDVREVASGFECGIAVEGFQNILEGDTFEIYLLERVERTL